MKIFKYEVEIDTSFSIKMPVNSKILNFHVQNNIPYIWVLVDEDNPLRERYFSIVGTGEEIDILCEQLIYIGTIHIKIEDMNIVWHLFEDIT